MSVRRSGIADHRARRSTSRGWHAKVDRTISSPSRAPAPTWGAALSSTCPHLGCQVRWEAQNDRFFCPCHNGVFDQSGVATAGPPGEAGQSLPKYELKVEDGLLHIAVPPPQFAEGKAEPTPHQAGIIEAEETISGPGHDPCLGCGDGGRNA